MGTGVHFVAASGFFGGRVSPNMGKNKPRQRKEHHQGHHQRHEQAAQSQQREDGHPDGLATPGSAEHRKNRKQQKKASSENENAGSIGWSMYALYVSVPIIVIALVLFFRQRELQSKVSTPLHAPFIIPANATSPELSPEKFWGTYRSQLYFGLRTRSPQSLLTGLMWFTQFVEMGPPKIRHWCNQDDRLPSYGWVAHDGMNFGVQEIRDHTVTLITEFVKKPGGLHGGDWSARITAKPLTGGEDMVISLMFYAVLDGNGELHPVLEKGRLVAIQGWTQELGKFIMKFPKPTSNVKKNNYLATYAPRLDKLTDTAMSGMGMMQFGNNVPYVALRGRVKPQVGEGEELPQPNFIMQQVTVSLPFEMEILFLSGSVGNRMIPLSGDTMNNELGKHSINFENKFNQIFDLENKGYNQKQVQMAKNILSNVMGGIGYFYGSSKVQSVYNSEPVDYWNTPLYTGVPSRSFFPRGFLWDEGFHNLLISKWDMEISKEIIGHWLDTMNVEGWIPREQILGVEASAKVPTEFIVQRNENANPPTFFLPLQEIVKKLINSDKQSDKLYLKNLFPRLKAWYNWYNTTQIGTAPFTYHWRGRDAKVKYELNPKTLTSGLDDYPRASHPTDNERHVDLRCWMALASGVMADIAKTIGEPWQAYQASHDLLTDNALLDELHWSESAHQYSDWGLHSNQVKLVKIKEGRKPFRHPTQNMEYHKERVTKQEPTLQFVNMFGYVSLFPFMLQIVDPSSPKLDKILTDLRNPKLLWTNFGLRSLAKNAPLYQKHNTEHDPPYWRGYIWINMNYLTVRALHYYSNTPGPYQDRAKTLYQELRKNVVSNILNQYEKTGYVWENYDDKTGEGKGCHPFTGWTSLVVLMMSENY